MVPLFRESVPIGTIVIRRTKCAHLGTANRASANFCRSSCDRHRKRAAVPRAQESALEQQTATSEILGVIASSPTDIQPVLVLLRRMQRESATRSMLKSGASKAIWSVRRNYGVRLTGARRWRDKADSTWFVERPRHTRPAAFTSMTCAEREEDYADVWSLARRVWDSDRSGRSTFREGTPLGQSRSAAPRCGRSPTSRSTSRNLRRPSGHRHRERAAVQELRSATQNCARRWSIRRRRPRCSGIISRSPTDVQPVLDAIVESAARVCGIDDVVLRLQQGRHAGVSAHFGPIPIGRVEISIDEPHFRWMREHGTLHVPDTRAQNDFPTAGRRRGLRTWLVVPLRQQGELIGSLAPVASKCAPSPRRRSSCLRRSPIKP